MAPDSFSYKKKTKPQVAKLSHSLNLREINVKKRDVGPHYFSLALIHTNIKDPVFFLSFIARKLKLVIFSVIAHTHKTKGASLAPGKEPLLRN